MQKIQKIVSFFSSMRGKKLTRERKINLLVTIIICISLLTFSFAIKNFFSEWYWREQSKVYAWEFNWPQYNTTVVTFENGTIVTTGTLNITRTWFIEAYNDAAHYYEPYLFTFRFQNWNPYSGGTYEKDPLHGYAYGPMFIYGLYLISLFVSLFNPGLGRADIVAKSVKWTHIAFDAFCVVTFYLIIISLKAFRERKITKHTLGFLSSTFFLFVPINLLYVDCIHLNTPQMAFFTLLSFLFFIKEKYRVSAFFLAVAWLSKQMPLFLLIPWLFIIWKKKSLKESLLDFLVPFLVTTFLLSLPWLFISPYAYVWRVFGPGKPITEIDLDLITHTVTFSHSFEFLGKPGLANFYTTINNFMIPFLLAYVVVVLISYFRGKKIGNDETVFTIFTSWVLINTHLFISRGIYKYYNAFLTPFVFLSILVFLESQISSLIDKRKKKLNKLEEEKDEEGKERLNFSNRNLAILKNASLYVSFLLSCAFFYYWNFVLIAKDRNLHPLFLLILFVLVSLLLPPDLYNSLVEKKSYIMIKEDSIEFYHKTTQALKKIQAKFKRNSSEESE